MEYEVCLSMCKQEGDWYKASISRMSYPHGCLVFMEGVMREIRDRHGIHDARLWEARCVREQNVTA